MSVVADYVVNFCGYTMCLEEMIIRYKFRLWPYIKLVNYVIQILSIFTYFSCHCDHFCDKCVNTFYYDY